MDSSKPIGSQICSVDFSNLSDPEVREVSVKQITNPQVFDNLGHPITNGLYDLSLGAFLRNTCSTCGLTERQGCPGHQGHIELPVPVYNPLFFVQLYNLLRASCVHCHRFKIAASEAHLFTCQLVLLQHGLVNECGAVAASAEEPEEAEEVEETFGSDEKKSRDNDAAFATREKFVAASIVNSAPITARVLEARKDVIKAFYTRVARPRCANCKLFSPGYRKDGFVKLFEKPLNDKQVTINRANGSESRAGMAGSKYVLSSEVHSILSQVFANEQPLVNALFSSRPTPKAGPVTPDFLFRSTLVVPPTRFRLPSKLGDTIHENPMNELLSKVLGTCLTIKTVSGDLLAAKSKDAVGVDKKALFSRLMNTFVTLQNDVNAFMDSTKSQTVSRLPTPGIKQALEKKEGLFRKHMMGKRVNFAARSVISPDPKLETNEVGVPPVFAKKLSFPEPVTAFNLATLRQAVINGPDKWPGALQVQNEDGSIISLVGMEIEQRKAVADQLLTPQVQGALGQKKVHRHLRNNDMVLMNRQPTLHKASMMGHRVKVLPGEKTLRIHYANTGAYNADFDGDEMNMHFPQSQFAQAEARVIASTDSQYVTPTAGAPVRGLIQDHISAGLWVTSKDTFFSREKMQEMVYGCLRPEDGHTTSKKIKTLPPAVWKPVPLWTGKQIISTVLLNITPLGVPGLNLESKNKVKSSYWGSKSSENQVVFCNGEHLCGILDKSQYGASKYGVVHAVHELYGAETAGKFLSVLGRLFTHYIISTAFTCGMEDICLTREGNQERKRLFEETTQLGLDCAVEATNFKDTSSPEFLRRLEEISRDPHKLAVLDTTNMGKSKVLTSKVSGALVPSKVAKPFPRNAMQSMSLTGAKGSPVNVTQIMCLLGQQTLEGKRPPLMVSGKSLPCFKPYETEPRAGGYIADRFYSGVRPQEYYFHCMAGREGLIDTAVKTATSGYLQRCLIKQLEGLHVTYDGTVRDTDGSMLQFLYGGDALDTVQETYLNQFDFCHANADTLKSRYDLAEIADKLDLETANKYNKKLRKAVKKQGSQVLDSMDPVVSKFSPARHIGSVSSVFASKLRSFVKEKLAKSKQVVPGKESMNESTFEALMHLKYMRSLVQPGEAVGIIAAQSIGEPSTQMTLNTFHFAGHGEANVTLGIPRLREIVMTASSSIKTPQMYLPLQPEITEEMAGIFCKSFTKINFSELVDQAVVIETGKLDKRSYNITINFYSEEEYEEEYNVTKKELALCSSTNFLTALEAAIKKELSNQKKELSGVVFVERRAEVSKEINDEKDADEEKENRYTTEAVSYGDEEEEKMKEKDEDSENESVSDNSSDDESDPDTDMSDVETETVKSQVSTSAMSQNAKDRQNQVISAFNYISQFDFDDEKGQWCRFTVDLPSNTQKLLMVDMVEETCRNVVVREVPKIGRCLIQRDGSLLTEGVNFQAIFDEDEVVNVDGVTCNDVSAVLKTYGVEAARTTIINEIVKVFGTYGITIGHRHLELIADYMTREGSYLAFNRSGIDSSTSSFKKMSYETTCQFLTKAVLNNERENLESPSATLVVGNLTKVGTGSFDVMAMMKV